jgi:hypothetical protein
LTIGDTSLPPTALALKISHCQFVTDNDEIFIFSFSATRQTREKAVAGFVCGGAVLPDRVRYVLMVLQPPPGAEEIVLRWTTKLTDLRYRQNGNGHRIKMSEAN